MLRKLLVGLLFMPVFSFAQGGSAKRRDWDYWPLLLTNLQSGMYVLKLSKGAGSKSQRFTKN